MDANSLAAIIANDLDNMTHRIEALPAHENYTEALLRVGEARLAINKGRMDLHQRDMRKRFAKADE